MNKGKLLVVVTVWICIIGIAAMAWKLWIVPKKEVEQKQAQAQQQQQIVNNTIATSRYDKQIDFAIDSFSGFAVLRSPKFAEELAAHRVKLNLIDDGANNPERIKAIKTGKVQMGCFTIDALLANSVGEKIPPAPIIALVDETRGADAIVAYKEAFPNINSLNAANVKFVAAQGPSETLTRVLIYNFQLPNLSADPFIRKNDAKDVFELYRKSKPEEKQVYVLWEPYVTKMLDNPNLHVLVDSGRFRGYIVDAIVVNRDFLFKNGDMAKLFLECYFRASYSYRANLVKLILDDARSTNTTLSEKEAQRFIDGVWLKNTSDNYAHFGLLQGTSHQHVEDIVGNITKVLVASKAIASDPTNGKPNTIYFDGILKKMQAEGFYPGFEKSRDDKIVLPALTDQQWESLVPVGTLSVPPLVCGRGSATLTDSSVQMLDELVEKLKTWQFYYLFIRGNTTSQGDVDANIKLANSRAKATADYLVAHGVNVNRIRCIAAEPSDQTSVSFTLGQPAY